MCGIAGLLGGEQSHLDALAALANTMAAQLRHRGPDDAGAWGTGQVGLAQRRLAILDLTPAGRQPMASRSGRWVLIFNGEIYNHRELRADLLAAGHRFDGTGDTETLVEAIDAWGVMPALHRLNGMFAVAAFDLQRSELWLVRDRLGEKPLYWCSDERRLLFASELRGMRVVPGFEPTIDQRAAAALLRWSFIPHPHTIYRGVHQLAPGELLRATLTGERVHVEATRWWNLADVVATAQAQPPLTVHQCDQALDELLGDAVRMRLLSDVPVGAFLSGGIDSGLVAAYAHEALGGSPLRTFTVSMPELAHDEAAAAAMTAQVLGTDHQLIRLSRTDAAGLITSMADVWDEPFADPSMVPTALMCRAVATEVKVCLSGDGGDELFGGYNRHVFGDRLAQGAGRLPGPIRRGLGAALGAVPPRWFDRAGSTARPLLPTGWHVPAVGDKVHKAAAVLRGRGGAWEALAGVWSPGDLGPTPYGPEAVTSADAAEAMLLTDTLAVLPDQMLVKTDRASMAASLEVRVPIIDHRLVTLAWRLPMGMKASGGVGKLPLRRLAAAKLPAGVAARPKHGFDPPLATWLRGELRHWAGDTIGSARCVSNGWLDRAALDRVWDQHQSGRRNHEYRLWAVLMLESWLAAHHG